jgi:hypothetical protein
VAWEPSEPIRVTDKQWRQLERTGRLVMDEGITDTGDEVTIRLHYSGVDEADARRRPVQDALDEIGDHRLGSLELHELAARVDALADDIFEAGG